MSITNAVLENLPQNRDISLNYKRKIIFLDPFLCKFLQDKTWDKQSVNIDHV